ncbi:sulfite exporter TauE/SafE family protein [Gynuella sunshinyii]|uniref:Probable membrane transporter protein n=1 Tax=Gynuella sunshinyii YC6258 TaxID=1445510 RepID=A0A0C5VD24_9GAMM|nr:sulfite exporter TauE/SafE family protein [Gynuella sunshinyii]AJQ92427.1 putative permease [Gynuella sunshinyii YC6258]
MDISYFHFFLVAIPVVLIVGISKAGFGGGLGVVGVPAMTLIMGPVEAAAILLPVLCFMDLFGVQKFWRQWNVPAARLLIPSAMAGIALGTLTFAYMNEHVLKLILGILSLAFVANTLRKPTQSGRQGSAIAGRFWGTVTGYTSFVAHAGGPPVNMYLLPLRLPKTEYVATTVLFFAVVNYVKLIPYYFLDQLYTEHLFKSLILLPFAYLGVILGVFLHTRVSDKVFYQLCYAFLAVVGIKLIYDGVTGF